jgi:Pro-kumamolisin, activation domain
MNHRVRLAGMVAVAGLATAWQGAAHLHAAPNPPPARILVTQPIDEHRLVRLAGNTRHEANAATDRGRVPDDFPMEHMLLLLKRPPELEQAIEEYIDSLTDKSSPNFHQWLLPAEQGQLYGPAQEDVDKVTGWLRSHGFTVGYVYPTRRVIDFSGTAGQVKEAFHTEIHRLDVRGEQHFANMSDPQIPEALASVVLGVVSMHDFKPQSFLERPTQYTVTNGTATDELLVPTDVETIYNLTPVYRQGIYGQGQTIVVVEDAMPWESDPTTYQTEFNLGVFGGTWSNTHPNSGGNCTAPTSPNGDEGEADIDVEIALAVAPGATIQAASCSDTATFGGLIAIENLVNAGSPPAVISMSYGECEALNTAAGNAAFYSAFQSAAMAGVSIFASSGDSLSSLCSGNEGLSYGSFGIGVTGWGSTPYNVAVGGTDFEDTYNAGEGGLPVSTYWNTSNSTTYGNAKSYMPEIPWNDSCASWLISNYVSGSGTTYGSSGFCSSATAGDDGLRNISGGSGGPSGCALGTSGVTGEVTAGCAGYAKPSWQSGIFGNPADGVRDLPDVSLFAANGVWGHLFVICWSDTANFGPEAGDNNQGAAPCTNPPDPVATSGATWSGFGGTSFAAPMMAAIQALVDQKWNIRAGNPNPIYYSIANAEFGASGNSDCYSINQPPRRGLSTACVFYDITQGDNDGVCRGSRSVANCYDPSGAYGVLSTAPVSSISVIDGGSDYASAPACALDVPADNSEYLSPSGGTIYGGGTAAGTCTASLSGGSVVSIAIIGAGAGYVGGSGCTLSGGGGTGATCAAEVSTSTAATTYAPAFYATPGWDFATGIGTVNAYNLIYNTAW